MINNDIPDTHATDDSLQDCHAAPHVPTNCGGYGHSGCGMCDACMTPFTPPAQANAGVPEIVGVLRDALIERLRKRAKEDRECAQNSQVIADLLEPQMVLFNAATTTSATHNRYAVRMAIDHKQSIKRDTQYAEDLEAAIALLAQPEPAAPAVRIEAAEPIGIVCPSCKGEQDNDRVCWACWDRGSILPTDDTSASLDRLQSLAPQVEAEPASGKVTKIKLQVTPEQAHEMTRFSRWEQASASTSVILGKRDELPEPATDVVERVARAMRASVGLDGHPPQCTLDLARAAIAAMPSATQIRADALREAADEAHRIGTKWAEDADCPTTSRKVGDEIRATILALIDTPAAPDLDEAGNSKSANGHISCWTAMHDLKTQLAECAKHLEKRTEQRDTALEMEHKLTALLVERDTEIALLHERDKIQCDFIEKTLNDCAAKDAEIAMLREALDGMIAEWEKLTRYGSPMIKAANEAVKFARTALAKAQGLG